MPTNSEWRAISEAPKDETGIDIFAEKKDDGFRLRITDCWYSPDSEDFMTMNDWHEPETFSALGIKALAWMPIPEPPQREGD